MTTQPRNHLQFSKNPHHLLLLTGLALLLASFFSKDGETIDIHLHDTYYVVSQGHSFLTLAFILGLLWLLYIVTRGLLSSKTLTWIHVIITTVAALSILFIPSGGLWFNSQPRQYVDLSSSNYFSENDRHMKLIFYSVSALVFVQALFLINIVTGIFKRIASPKHRST